MRDPRRAGSFEKCDVIICAMQIEFELKYEFCLPNSKAPGNNISVTVKYGDTLELTHHAEASDKMIQHKQFSFILLFSV